MEVWLYFGRMNFKLMSLSIQCQILMLKSIVVMDLGGGTLLVFMGIQTLLVEMNLGLA